MAYTLKSSGIATNLVVCVAVDEDGTIKDFKSNAITLGTGVAASVATGSWKSISSPKYFVTTANGTFDFFGVTWDATQPTIDQADADGMAAFFACHGSDAASTAQAPFISFGSDVTQGLKRVSDSDQHGTLGTGGGTKAITATNLPTDGSTKFSFGYNYESADSSEAFYGLESGSLASEDTEGSDGGFGGNGRSIFGIGGGSGQGNQPFKPYIACLFDRKLTLGEMQSLHDDWFGTLFDGGGGASDQAKRYDDGIPAAYFADIGFAALYGHQQLGIPLSNRDSNTATVVSADGSISGVLAANPIGASRVDAAGSEAFVLGVSPVGASLASGAASVSGVLNLGGVGASSAQASADGAIAGVSSFGPVGASRAGASGSQTYTSSEQPIGASTASAAGVDTNVFSMDGVGSASTGVVAADGSIAGVLGMQGAGAIIVSSAGSISGVLNVQGSTPATASRRSDGPRPKKANTDDDHDLMDLAMLLVPLISKGGPLWVR